MPTSKPTARTPLPYAILYSALGIVLDGRLHGAVKAVAPADLSRAIAIATANRQRAGHVLPGSRTLSPAGLAWQRAKKRERTAPRVAEDVAEWARLVALSHVPAPKRPAKAPVPKAPEVYALRVMWSAAPRQWRYTLKHQRALVASGGLSGVRRNSSALALLTAATLATTGVRLPKAALVRFTLDRP
jgi:hypothetical protein